MANSERSSFCPGRRRGMLLVLLVLGVGVSLALAQLPTATVLGTVKDSTGAVVPDTAVTVRSTETGLTRTTTSGANGVYRVVALPVGSYEIRAEHPGFRTEARGGITLAVGQEAVVNFALQVGAIEQTIEVTAEAPLVNTTSGSLGDLISGEQIADLPVRGRNYINLTLMQPGIQEHRGGRGSTSNPGVWISVMGAPTRSNNFLLDGAPIAGDTGGTTGGATGSTLGIEGIREWKMVTNSYSAEYGMRMGGQMTMVSKGGTNEFHGSLLEYLRNSALDARNFFDYKTETNPRRLPAFTRNQFGGSLGGPIQRDKLFFFGTYEGLRERLGQTIVSDTIPPECRVVTNNPCAVTASNPNGNVAPVIRPFLALYPQPNLPLDRFTYPATTKGAEDFVQGRVDYNLSASDMFFVRYNYAPSDAAEPLDFPPFFRLRENWRHILSGSDSHIFSPALLGTFRFSFSRTKTNVDSPHDELSGPQYSFMEGRAMGIISIGGVTGLGPSQNTPAPRMQDTYTWSGDIFYTRGQHSLKFGTLINWTYLQNQNGNQFFGTMSYPSITRFLNALPQTIQAQGLGSDSRREYRWITYGFYLQDDFRATSNLMLNLGLRYEFHTTFKEINNRGSALRDAQRDTEFTVGPPFKNPSLGNISPRFGFAWDARGDGRTAVRGGFGLLWDIGSHGSSFGNLPSAQPPFSFQGRTQNPPVLTLPFGFAPGATVRAVRTMEWELEEPHMLQYSLTVERQLPLGIGLSLGYAGSRGFNLSKSIEGNPTIPLIRPEAEGQGQPGGFFWPAGAARPRVNPAWDTIQYHTGSSSSWYNSLQFVVRKRMSRGLQFQSSYTWAKLIDESQSQSAIDQGGAYHPWLRQHDRGLAAFHVAHALRVNSIYRLPQMPVQGFLGKVLNGWMMSGILSMQTGVPFAAGSTSGNRSRSQAGADQSNLVAGRTNSNMILGGPERYFDPTAFYLQPEGTLGNGGRNFLIGPGTANLDFSLAKDTAVGFLGESGKLEFRAEFFNIFNRVNFENPGGTVFTGTGATAANILPTAGRINNTNTTSRQIQVSLKLVW